MVLLSLKSLATVIINTLDNPVYGKVSKLSCASSPIPPYIWPNSILAAVTVVTDIPSPKNRITFLAMLLFIGLVNLFFNKLTSLLNRFRTSVRVNNGAKIKSVSKKDIYCFKNAEHKCIYNFFKFILSLVHNSYNFIQKIS